MTIWIIAAVLIGGIGALGRQIGAIRMGISLIGAIVAYVATLFLTGIVADQLPSVGMRNPIYIWLMAPALVFFGVFLAINAMAQGAYIKVKVFFDYRAKEDARIRFARLDTNVGLACGLAAGVVHLLIVMVPIYMVGYVTLQLDSPNGNPFYVNLISKARADMDGSGFDKIAAAMSPETDDIFLFADTAGLIYNNKSVQDFLREYPLFYSMAENESIFKAFVGNQEEVNPYDEVDEDAPPPYDTLVRNQGSIKAIIDHPTTMDLITNPDFMDRINELDYADLMTFLNTGHSPVYAEEKFVGKWKIDTARTVRETQRRWQAARLSSSAVNNMKLILNNTAHDITLTVAPDGFAYMKSANSGVVKFSPFARQRMSGQEIASFIVRKNSKKPLNTLAMGNWTGGDDGVKFDLKGSGAGNTFLIKGVKTGNTKVVGGSLMFDYGEYRIVFYKHL
jgi:hypothetical protein